MVGARRTPDSLTCPQPQRRRCADRHSGIALRTHRPPLQTPAQHSQNLRCRVTAGEGTEQTSRDRSRMPPCRAVTASNPPEAANWSRRATFQREQANQCRVSVSTVSESCRRSHLDVAGLQVAAQVELGALGNLLQCAEGLAVLLGDTRGLRDQLALLHILPQGEDTQVALQHSRREAGMAQAQPAGGGGSSSRAGWWHPKERCCGLRFQGNCEATQCSGLQRRPSSPAQPSPAQPRPAQLSPAQPSPAQPTPTLALTPVQLMGGTRP